MKVRTRTLYFATPNYLDCLMLLELFGHILVEALATVT